MTRIYCSRLNVMSGKEVDTLFPAVDTTLHVPPLSRVVYEACAEAATIIGSCNRVQSPAVVNTHAVVGLQRCMSCVPEEKDMQRQVRHEWGLSPCHWGSAPKTAPHSATPLHTRRCMCH